MVYWKKRSEIPPRGKSVWIADDIRNRVESGDLNGKLPSERDLASGYGVNFKTVSKALALLVDNGLLRRSVPHGTFVNSNFSKPSSSQNVALLIKTQGHLFEKFAGSLIDKLGSAGHHTTVCGLSSEMTLEMRLPRISRTLAQKLDAVLADTDNFSRDELAMLEKSAPKVIHINRRALELGFDTNADFVLSDSWLGAYIGTRHLIDSGHKKPMFLSHHQDKVSPVSFRYEFLYLMKSGYRDAMIEAGLEDAITFFGELSEDYAETNKSNLVALFQSPASPDAVFASQDNRIVRNAAILQKFGIDLRKDVVGYNNTPWSAEWETPFTSVSIQEEKMADIILAHVEGKSAGTSHVKPELVVRRAVETGN